MKIVLTGGGTGGHFYPLISVAEEIYEIAEKEKLLEPTIYYIGPDIFDPRALSEQNIIFKKSPAGKVRKYFSIKNFTDYFKTAFGIIKATIQLYFIYPDVVFSKGGYAAFPTTVAARLLRIPLVIHESDALPGKANLIAAKWARAIATAYPTTEKYFKGVDSKKIALVGNPIRKSIAIPVKDGAFEYLKLNREIPTILVLGGSSGSQAINDLILNTLKLLLPKYQIIHQVGKNNLEYIRGISNVILQNSEYKERYKPFSFLNQLAMRMSAGAASIVISRSGSNAITEISAWGLPSIVIPIPKEISHDQTENAFIYARFGAATVLKQKNLTPNILFAEIERIMNDKEMYTSMQNAARKFYRPDAAHKIARLLYKIILEHEE